MSVCYLWSKLPWILAVTWSSRFSSWRTSRYLSTSAHLEWSCHTPAVVALNWSPLCRRPVSSQRYIVGCEPVTSSLNSSRQSQVLLSVLKSNPKSFRSKSWKEVEDEFRAHIKTFQSQMILVELRVLSISQVLTIKSYASLRCWSQVKCLKSKSRASKSQVSYVMFHANRKWLGLQVSASLRPNIKSLGLQVKQSQLTVMHQISQTSKNLQSSPAD